MKYFFGIAAGIVMSTWWLAGIHAGFWGVIIATFVLWVLNFTAKPILMVFSLPLTPFTFGVSWWIMNSTLLYIVSGITPGFYIESFWSAMWGH